MIVWAVLIWMVNAWPIWLGYGVGDAHGMMLGVVAWAVLNHRGKT